MLKFIKNYKSSIILLSSIIIGMIVGIIFKEKTECLKPFGDLFLNLLLVIIVPLIFLTIATSIGKMRNPKRIGKILFGTLFIFIITSLISLFIGFGFTKKTNLINNKDTNKIEAILDDYETDIDSDNNVNFLERTVDAISVSNFNDLITNDNIIALILFSILFGLSINLCKEKGKPILNVLESCSEVIQKFIKIIMYYAPIGLGCYFAALVGSFGSTLIFGYTKLFIIYLLACIFIYFIMYSLYAFIGGGKKGFINYWKNIISPTVCALST